MTFFSIIFEKPNIIIKVFFIFSSTFFRHLSNFRHLCGILCYNRGRFKGKMMKKIKYSSKKRTHERIKKAFAELLAQKEDLKKITVAELATKAEVTRGTFYAHFNNIFEVASEIESDFIETLDLAVGEMTDVDDFPFYFHKIFEFLAENEELYRQLLMSDAPLVFINRLNTRIEKTIREIMKEREKDRPMLDLDIAFFTDGATYMIMKYFRGEIQLSLDEIEWYLKQRIFEMFLR